jgi:hypothetical protein
MLAPQVGDQSDFVTGFSRVLAETAPRIGPALSPLHFRYFCDKLAVSFCPRFYEYIFRCAGLADFAASFECVQAAGWQCLCSRSPAGLRPALLGILPGTGSRREVVVLAVRPRLLPAVGDGAVSKAEVVQVP